MGIKGTKRLTFEEREIIEKLIKNNISACGIARAINRSKNSVITEIRRNGGRDEYRAQSSQEKYYINMSKKHKILSDFNKGKSPMNTLLSRVDSLEMQVEILFETIKGLLNDSKNNGIQ